MAATRRKFRFQQLETRHMRAADILFNDATDVIEIFGTPGEDTAEIFFGEDEIEIELTYPDDDGSGTDDTFLQMDLADVQRVVFYGYDGDDELTAEAAVLFAGADIVLEFHGDGDNDTFDNQTYAGSYIWGGTGNDTLLGGGDGDRLYGEQGDDTLHGRGGNDIYIFAGANLGHDTIDEVFGQGGMDHIDLRELTLSNGTVNDRTYLNLSNTSEQYVYEAADGQHFRLTINDPQSLEEITGTSIDDYFYGNNQANYFAGLAGDDWLAGGGGNDLLAGYDGNDVLLGEKGADTLDGSFGHDLLVGDEFHASVYYAYDNTLIQGAGQLDIVALTANLRQQFNAGDVKKLDDAFHIVLEAAENTAQYGAADILLGGNDNDVLYGGSGADSLYGETHDDFLIGGRGADDLFGDNETDWAQGADYLFGGSGTDDLLGRGGADWLLGGSGKDTLNGGDGNDFLYGRFDGQADTMTGGRGRDTFVRYFEVKKGVLVERGEENETDRSREDVIERVVIVPFP